GLRVGTARRNRVRAGTPAYPEGRGGGCRAEFRRRVGGRLLELGPAQLHLGAGHLAPPAAGASGLGGSGVEARRSRLVARRRPLALRSPPPLLAWGRAVAADC